MLSDLCHHGLVYNVNALQTNQADKVAPNASVSDCTTAELPWHWHRPLTSYCFSSSKSLTSEIPSYYPCREPTNEDIMNIVHQMYKDDGLSQADIQVLVDTFKGQTLDFFGAVRASTYDSQIRDWMVEVSGRDVPPYADVGLWHARSYGTTSSTVVTGCLCVIA
eukprot:GHUV01055704.1.p1 GENE.GHUV01055704.1~~GHUV01055704.1.p1  ORF type:complete len:164 (+),score=26.87 GHUV01055704.1:1037-1528(+)